MATALNVVEKTSAFYQATAALHVGADLGYNLSLGLRGREIHRIDFSCCEGILEGSPGAHDNGSEVT